MKVLLFSHSQKHNGEKIFFLLLTLALWNRIDFERHMGFFFRARKTFKSTKSINKRNMKRKEKIYAQMRHVSCVRCSTLAARSKFGAFGKDLWNHFNIWFGCTFVVLFHWIIIRNTGENPIFASPKSFHSMYQCGSLCLVAQYKCACRWMDYLILCDLSNNLTPPYSTDFNRITFLIIL